MSFVARVLSEKSRVYCLQFDAGTPQACYYFIQVDAAKERAFVQALETGEPKQLEDFGTIIASGWGVPGAGVREVMAAKYNIAFHAD